MMHILLIKFWFEGEMLYGRLFGKSPPHPAKNFRKIGIAKACRQKVAVQSTAALGAYPKERSL